MGDLNVKRGDSKIWNIVATRKGEIYPITGAEIYLAAKYNLGDTDFAIFKYVGSGITITDGPNGEAQIVLDPADTQSMPDSIQKLKYDLKIITALSESFTVASGYIVIDPNIATQTTPAVRKGLALSDDGSANYFDAIASEVDMTPGYSDDMDNLDDICALSLHLSLAVSDDADNLADASSVIAS